MGFFISSFAVQSEYMKVIYLGAGTFWLTEAIFARVKGVKEVIPGYMGGDTPNPSSESVATGTTGHVEVVKILYDETIIPTGQLLRIFYAMHDPTALKHSSHGIGSQYRPVIFYTDELDDEAISNGNGSDMSIIPRIVQEVQERLPEDLVVTTHIMTAKEFYAAEEYHYGYFQRNPEAAYSIEIIAPKVQEVQARFPDNF